MGNEWHVYISFIVCFSFSYGSLLFITITKSSVYLVPTSPYRPPFYIPQTTPPFIVFPSGWQSDSRWTCWCVLILGFWSFFGRVLTSLIHNRTNRRRFDTGKSSRYLHQVLLIVPTTKVGPCHHAWTFTTLNSFWLVGSLESIIPGT